MHLAQVCEGVVSGIQCLTLRRESNYQPLKFPKPRNRAISDKSTWLNANKARTYDMARRLRTAVPHLLFGAVRALKATLSNRLQKVAEMEVTKLFSTLKASKQAQNQRQLRIS